MPTPDRLLIVDGDKDILDFCFTVLAKEALEATLVSDGQEALKLIDKWEYDLVIVDQLSAGDGLQILKKVKADDAEAGVIVMAAKGTVEAAVQAMQLGADSFLSKPFSDSEFSKAVGQALSKRRLVVENLWLKQEMENRLHWPDTVYISKAMIQVMEIAKRVAPTDSTVLLTGESGTGKSLIARRIHDLSGRSGRPFMAVDCGSLVETLFESELFGHVKGAFTGADRAKLGKFELAHTGTVFFDEIGNISLDVQAKLLKAVDLREISKVGSHRIVKVDVRILAATNQDLQAVIASGRFREDLFYRLNVVSIHVPPLRERREDIPALIEFFMKMYNHTRKMNVEGLTPQVLQALTSHDWPGNVRELANIMERMIVLTREGVVDMDALAFTGWRGASKSKSDEEIMTLEAVERSHIEKVLAQLDGRRGLAAQALGVDRKTLRTKIKKYGLG